MENNDEYIKLSHKLAKKQLIERFILEMQFNNNKLLEELIKEYHNVEIFTYKEYEEAFKKAKKILQIKKP